MTIANAKNTRMNDSLQKSPVYAMIYHVLKAEILANVYAANTPLPSENQLCQRFNVVRNTVRKALQLLVDENYIVKVPGLGSMIKEKSTGQAASARSADADKLPFLGRNILFVIRDNHLKNTETENFYLNLFSLLESNVAQNGYNLFFKPVSKESNFADIVKRTFPAAVIFVSYINDIYYEQALAMGLPCVSINHFTPHMTSIVSNNTGGAYQVTQELINRGHRRLAIIAGKKDYQTTSERLVGVRSCLRDNNIPADEVNFFYGNWFFSSGYEIAGQICQIDPVVRPTAIFAFNDDMAYGSLSYFEKNDSHCLDKISIVGFDNSERYKNMFPAISTVDVNLPTIVEYAGWFIFGRLENKAPRGCAKIQIETTYIDKGTVRLISAD